MNAKNKTAPSAPLMIAVALALSALVLAAATAALAPARAHAATLAAADFEAGGKVVASYVKGDAGNSRSFRCAGKVTGLSSSDPDVVCVRMAKAKHGFDVALGRPGRAKVTYNLDSARRSVTFRVVKYANPVKTFKVGPVDYAGKFTRAKSYQLPNKSGNLGKLRVVAAAGWKLKKLYTGFSERNSLKVRNGATLGGTPSVRAVLVSKSTGVRETIELRNGGSAQVH